MCAMGSLFLRLVPHVPWLFFAAGSSLPVVCLAGCLCVPFNCHLKLVLMRVVPGSSTTCILILRFWLPVLPCHVHYAARGIICSNCVGILLLYLSVDQNLSSVPLPHNPLIVGPAPSDRSPTSDQSQSSVWCRRRRKR